ncbi:MAG: phosphoribosylformylglycinamidine synthase subunit PurS [Candidatus Sumerlaeota bacterium]|nr:phosphoribosylformylglycinamidine synthase subunit PurS [Candidatus Sumerlaeota bacterium]
MFDATVAVTLKPGVFDVQGQTIQQALGHLKHRNIERLRAGRWFEIQLESESAEAARAQLEKISHDLLSNPVIEDFKICIL